jgi:hypothetical protein
MRSAVCLVLMKPASLSTSWPCDSSPLLALRHSTIPTACGGRSAAVGSIGVTIQLATDGRAGYLRGRVFLPKTPIRHAQRANRR